MIKTVIVEITDARLCLDSGTRFFTSLEGENPGRSIKDHMVLGEILALLKAGKLRPGDRISEASSGSTARSLAHYAQEMGLRCVLFVPDHLALEQVELLKSLQADVYRVEPTTAYERYSRFISEQKVHPLDQLGDPRLSRHYAELGREALRQLEHIDAVVGAVGTGHSLLGVARGISAGSAKPTRKITAEPRHEKVSGIRNIDLERHGARDACNVGWFDERVLVDSDQYFPDLFIETTMGKIGFSQSFRLVLAAAKIKAAEAPHYKQTFFLIGATNHRQMNFTSNAL